MFDFRHAAMEVTTMPDIMTNRQNVSTDDIIRNFPDGITVNAFDFVPSKDGAYPVFTFAEAPDSFFFGGVVLMNVVQKWLQGFGGDVDGCNEALNKAGGVKIRMERGRTRAGNELVKVEIL